MQYMLYVYMYSVQYCVSFLRGSQERKEEEEEEEEEDWKGLMEGEWLDWRRWRKN